MHSGMNLDAFFYKNFTMKSACKTSLRLLQ